MVLGCLNYKHIRVFSLRPKIKLEEFIKFFGRIHTILSNQSFFLPQAYVKNLCFLLQFLFEGMEESGSEGLDEMVFSKKDTFLKVFIKLLLL